MTASSPRADHRSSERKYGRESSQTSRRKGPRPRIQEALLATAASSSRQPRRHAPAVHAEIGTAIDAARPQDQVGLRGTVRERLPRKHLDRDQVGEVQHRAAGDIIRLHPVRKRRLLPGARPACGDLLRGCEQGGSGHVVGRRHQIGFRREAGRGGEGGIGRARPAQMRKIDRRGSGQPGGARLAAGGQHQAEQHGEQGHGATLPRRGRAGKPRRHRHADFRLAWTRRGCCDMLAA